MPVFSSILQPAKPYHEAGNKNLAEMDADLSDRAARVIDNLKVADRSRFRQRIEQYQTYDQLPQDLKDIVDGKTTELTGQNGGNDPADPPSGYEEKGINKSEREPLAAGFGSVLKEERLPNA